MASSLLNRLKLIAGESIDTTDPTDPDNPYKYIDKYIKEYDITNPYIINAIKGVISSEGGIKGRPEASYANTSAKRIKEIFGARATKYTDEELNVIKKDPVRFYDMLYGPEAMDYFVNVQGWNPGNDQPGDGYKYRGRGLKQLTFKSQYKQISDQLKKKGYNIDLVKNPELLDTDPEIQALVAIQFMTNGLDKLSNSNSNVYKKKREQYSVDNWKDINDQKTASLVLANVQSGFGKTPRKEYQENVYNASLKFIPVQPTEGSRADLVAESPKEASFSINPVEEELVLNPFVGEKKSPGNAILDDIKYNPKIPKMIGNTEESVSNYLKGIENYEDVVLAQLAAEEEKNYQSSTDDYEKFAAQNSANEQIFPEVKVVAESQDEIIPLQKPVEQEQEKVIDMEYLNSIPDVNSFISSGSFTNESRSKEELKQAAETEQFIASPLKKNANSGYFGSGQSIFYPSTRQQKYGGGMSRKYFENGGPEDEIAKPTNPVDMSKGLLGRFLDMAKYSAARSMSKTELPEQGDLSYDEYLGTLNRKQLASIPFKEQMAKRDVEAENYHVNQVKDNMLKIASDLEGMDMKEDYEYLGVPWMGQQNIKQIGDGIDENVKIIDDTSSWFHKIPSEYYTGYQNEAGANVLPPYTCIGSYCAIGAKAGARFAEDTKYGKAGEPWKVLTGNYQVDDIEEEMGLYQKDAKDIEKGDAVRQNRDQGTSHTMLVTGMPDESGRYHTTYGSGWERGVFPGNWANIEWAQGEDNPTGQDVIVGYEGRLPAMKESLNKSQSLNAKYQEYLDQKAIAKLPIKEAKLIRTGPTKMPFIERKQYPNTRKGRKQEQQDNAYITAYMDRMQKK